MNNSTAATHNPAPTIAWTGLAALAVAMGIGRFAFTPILPMMQSDSGVSVAEGGWLASANYAGYLLGALSAGVVRIRPHIAIRAALLAISLSTLAMSLMDHLPVWILLRAVAGIASAWVLVFVSAWALERLAQLGAPAKGGTVYAGVGTGIAVAGAVCLALMGLGAHSTHAWAVLGAASLAVTAALWPFVGAGAHVASDRSEQDAPPLARAEFWRLVVCYGAFGFGYIIPATFLPVMGREVVPDPALFGLAWPVFGVAALASTLLAARIHRFLSHRGIWIAGSLVMALGVLLPVMTSGLAAILISALLVGGTFMVNTMAGMQEARRVAGARARALMAAMTSAFALGQIVGPVSVSALSALGTASGGFAPALVAAAVLLILSAALLMPRPG